MGQGAPVLVEGEGGAPVLRHNGTMASPSLTVSLCPAVRLPVRHTAEDGAKAVIF